MLHLLLRPRVPVLLAARSTRAASKLPNKDDVTPFSKEYTRSGTDDEIAQNKAAYDGSITNPVEEKAAVGREEGRPEQGSQNPLEYSGATPEVSHPPDDHAVKGGNKQASGGKVKAVE